MGQAVNLVLIVEVLIALSGVAFLVVRRRRAGSIVDLPGWEALSIEFERSRRYERSFVLVRFEYRGSGPAREASLRLMAEAGALLRSIDRAWLQGRHVFVLLPECEHQDGAAFVERVHCTYREHVVPESTRIVAFPRDGLTSEAILSALDRPELTVLDPPQALRTLSGGIPAEAHSL